VIDLEKTISDLVERKAAGSAEYRLAVRELAGLRYSYEEAGALMEELDPLGWGATRPLEQTDLTGQRQTTLSLPIRK
jgi:hypothetical protein